MKHDIVKVLKRQFEANIDKHALNVRIMLEKPTAIHDHTDFMTAVELELVQIAEYKDKLEALEHVRDTFQQWTK
jgi:hypothetical protein